MSDLGMTSEQRAAIAVHDATEGRRCIHPMEIPGMCMACAAVVDQIDAAVLVAEQAADAEWIAAIEGWIHHPRCTREMESMVYDVKHPDEALPYDVCDGCKPLRKLLARALGRDAA